jgi:hypothetical protein
VALLGVRGEDLAGRVHDSGGRIPRYVISALRQEWPALATALDGLAACPDLVTLLSQ